MTVDTVSGLGVVRPLDGSIHNEDAYEFYIKATFTGGSVGYLGPYTFFVGCTTNTVTFTERTDGGKHLAWLNNEYYVGESSN